MKSRILISIIALFFVLTAFESQGQTNKKEVSFEEVFSKVINRHPLLKTFEEKRKAVRFRAYQAGLLPNPELDLSVEDVFGSGDFGGSKSSETTLIFSQTVPLFGKTKKRRETVLFQEKVIACDEALTKLELFRQTARIFTEALYAQKKVKLYRELALLSERLVAVAEAKLQAGKIPETEKIRAEIVASETEMRLANARREYQTALRQLANLWGETKPVEFSLRGELLKIYLSPRKIKTGVEKHPALLRLKNEISQLEKRLELAKAEALPDVTLSAGVRWYNESDERAYLFGIAVPLPVFNRNKGEIEALAREITEIRLKIKSQKLSLERDLEAVLGRLRMVLKEIRTLEDSLLPRAEEIYRRNLEGYRYGKMEFLRVLDAQRTLFELHLGLLEAYQRYHLLRAEALYLVGRPEKNFF
ncbi:TolC family protein [Thermosulfurimonas dismutans]|uniref:Heavy metal RND efflux outer membrane protein, CzcC family n=1 Tax=Thermosulfurimonas dismutans TaxID=999894 RepID=A0A179D5V0_9BACT|nr:TolC family protein [Thermosulfurimonas dismutans]OAQ21480.1 hypothetical protein TDIS_0701 [Thermosulfurimonas dismutans]